MGWKPGAHRPAPAGGRPAHGIHPHPALAALVPKFRYSSTAAVTLHLDEVPGDVRLRGRRRVAAASWSWADRPRSRLIWAGSRRIEREAIVLILQSIADRWRAQSARSHRQPAAGSTLRAPLGRLYSTTSPRPTRGRPRSPSAVTAERRRMGSRGGARLRSCDARLLKAFGAGRRPRWRPPRLRAGAGGGPPRCFTLGLTEAARRRNFMAGGRPRIRGDREASNVL